MKCGGGRLGGWDMWRGLEGEAGGGGESAEKRGGGGEIEVEVEIYIDYIFSFGGFVIIEQRFLFFYKLLFQRGQVWGAALAASWDRAGKRRWTAIFK